MRIDAHQHYWKIDRGDYGWISPEDKTLHRDYLPNDLLPHLKKHDIDQTILVQAASTIEETEFLLELSEIDSTIAGVVGWLDLDDPNYVRSEEHTSELQSRGHLVCRLLLDKKKFHVRHKLHDSS